MYNENSYTLKDRATLKWDPGDCLNIKMLSYQSGLFFSRPKPVFAVQNGINWDKPVFPSFSRPKLGKTVQNREKLYFEQQNISEMWLPN